MSGGVKVQISLTAAGDVEFNVLQRSVLGGSKPLWRFQISRRRAATSRAARADPQWDRDVTGERRGERVAMMAAPCPQTTPDKRR